MGNSVIPLLQSILSGGGKTKIKYIATASDFPTKLEADAYVWDFYVFTANVTDNDPTKTNTNQSFLAGEEAVWNLTNYTVFGASALWGDDLTNLLPINPRNIDIATGKVYKINNENIFTRSNPELTTFDKSVFGSANELNAYWNKVDKDVAYFKTAPATQTLATSGAGDLAAKIATLVDGDILEIQTDASYSQITIPAGIRFAIRVKTGYNVQLNNAQAILLSNNTSDVFLSGFILDSNPSGAHSQGSGVAFIHKAQVYDVTFHNCTCRNNDHSAVLLSYHQSTGGDAYYNANLLSEFSERIAFVDCHFFSAANDPTEGGALTARGIKHLLIKNCKYNGQYLSRQILLQNCIETIISSPDIQGAGGAGNGEGIKMDKIGSPTYRNSAYIINPKVKDCIEGIDVDDDADAVIINPIVYECSAEGISVDATASAIIINPVTYNNFDGILQEAGAKIELKGANSFNNTNQNYRMDGGYVPDSSNISDPDQTFFNWVNFPVIQKEPTGFTRPEDVIVTYDSSTRTIALTGTVNGYYRGKKITVLDNTWVSPVHLVANGKYWLAYNDTGFNWIIDGNQKFYDLLIAFANYGTTDKWAQRECHGLMAWQDHVQDHDTTGTYRLSGGTLGDYVLNSTVVANRQPSVSAALIKDEDLQTTNPALAASGNYNNFYLSGAAGTANFNKTATEIVPLSGNQPYWNQFTGGTWQQTLMTNNYYMSIWLIAIPVTSDSASQAYRFVWVQGQNETLTDSQQVGLNPQDVNLGELKTISPEFVFCAQIIIRYLGLNWTWTQVRNLTGTRALQVGSPAGNYLSVVTSDASLTGLGTVASPLSVAGGTEDLLDRLQIRATPDVFVIQPHTAIDGIALNGFMPSNATPPSAVKYFQGLFDAGSSVPTHWQYLYSPNSTYPKYRWTGAISGGSISNIYATLDNTGYNIGTLLFTGGKLSLAGGASGSNTDFITIANTLYGSIGTKNSIYFIQDRIDSAAVPQARISFGCANNWIADSNQDADFNMDLTINGALKKAFSIIPDPVYTTDHLIKIEGGLIVNANSANPVSIDNGHMPNWIFMISGTTLFTVVSSCLIDQDLRSANTQTWLGLNLTHTTPANGLAINLATPLSTYETGIGVDNNNKFIYNNNLGIGVYASNNIMLMLDSNNDTTTTAKFSVRANSTTYTGGIEVFSVTENARALLKSPASASGNFSLFTIDTTDLDDQSALHFSKAGVRQWQLGSRNEIDVSDQNRFSIFNAPTSEVFTILQNGNVGINVASPTAAKLSVNQSSTVAAIPTLNLTQRDVSEGYINFIGNYYPTSGDTPDGAIIIEIGGFKKKLHYYPNT